MTDDFEINVNVTNFNGFPKYVSKKSFCNFLYLNARSLRNSLNDLQDFVNTQNFLVHVIIVTETWLRDSDVIYFNLTGYTSYHSIRKLKTGGGVAIFIHNSFDNASVIFEQDFNNNNILVVSLLQHNFKVIGVYRQPNNQSDPNAALFNDVFERTLAKYPHSFVFGDFNINLLTLSEYTIRYQNAFSLNGFVLLNEVSSTFPTRINKTNGSISCIDHVLTDFHLYDLSCTFQLYLFDFIADHKSIMLNVTSEKTKPQNIQSKTIKRINHNKIKKKKLLEVLKPASFNDFTQQVNSIISANSYEIKMSSYKRKEYISKKIVNLINIRNNYFKLKCKYPDCIEVQKKFKFYRNKISNLVKAAKKAFNNRYFQNNVNDPRKTWMQMKKLLFNCEPKNEVCELLVDNGIPITNTTNICNRFNNYFTTVADILLGSNQIDAVQSHQYHTMEQYDIKFHFTCPQCTKDEIDLIIDNLKNSKSCDVYGISNVFVKIHKDALSPTLTNLINHAMFSGIFPESLKLGVVTPIFKKGDRTDKANYRPITILPIFAKIFEYVILRRLEDHFQNNKIIHKNQFGYVKGSNTELAVIHILDKVYSSIDNRKSTALTCLDLSKAFDCVQHDIILNKLRKTQLSPFFMELLKSYFNERSQTVRLNNVLSDILVLNNGTAQGGVLSGPLFDLYVNSLNFLDLHSSMNLYCDDISIVTSAADPLFLKSYIQHDLALISEWLKFHFLFPNIDKSKYILFHNRRRNEFFTEQSLELTLNGIEIERVEHLRLLGLEIDETLNFFYHIKDIKSKIVPFTFALRRIRHLITEKTALLMYYGYIQSRIMYMSPVWSAAPKYLMESLEIAQRKSLRVVFKKNWDCSRTELYSRQLLPVSLLCNLSSNLLMFKIINNQAKVNITLQYVHEIHNYPTRTRELLVLPNYNIIFCYSNFFIRGLDCFNQLPAIIKQQVSIGRFKTKLKEHLYEAIIGSDNLT